MKTTRQAILDQALKLYNEKGISEVSVRLIADGMGISPGNLTYHFKRKSDITEELYRAFVDEVNNRFRDLKADQLNLQSLADIIGAMTRARVNYRFFMQDQVLIMSGHKTIREHYIATLQARKAQFAELLDVLVKKGIFRKAELAGEYELFYERIHILGTFWIPSARILHRRFDEELIRLNHRMIVQSIYPYLTQQGKQEWKRLTGEL